jgi:glycine betaine catabolism B
MADPQAPDDEFWRRTFFPARQVASPMARRKRDVTGPHPAHAGAGRALWLTRLFEGLPTDPNPSDQMSVFKDGVAVHAIPLAELGRETIIGRHPSADLQLESYKLAMHHVAILQNGGKFFVEGLDLQAGTLLDRKKLKPKTPVQLRDGSKVDLPGYRLEFAIAGSPPLEDGAAAETEEVAEIPSFFYTPPPPPASPLLVNLVDKREQLSVWSEGVTTLRVADIIEETHDARTYRFAGEQPLLFSYRPGQFVTFILNINGKEVKRSYSMSSSPSRPHLMEVTIKRVPGGLVSNWFCDQVKLGDVLTVKGPSGKFTCFDYPSSKMLFIGAGSGITPVVSMCRWITDTASDVDVKLLASFKSPTDIIFRKEYESWAARNRRFEVAITLTSGWHGTDFWTGFRGRLTEQMLNVFVPDLHDRHVFMCGPEPFADGVKKILHDVGFNMANMHTESFGSGRSAQGSKGGGKTLELKGPLHKVTFTKSGITVDCDEHVTLLELAEAHGIEIEYSCRVGSCGACEKKCKGEIKASEDCTIDAKAKAAGFIYACCSRSLGDLELQA